MVLALGRTAEAIKVNGRDAARVYANGRIVWPAQVDYANKLAEALGNGGLFGVRVTPVIANNQLRWQGNTGQGVTETQTPAGSAAQQQVNRIRIGNQAPLDLHRFTYGQPWDAYLQTLTDNHTWYIWSENAQQFYAIRANRASNGRIGDGFVNYSVFHQSGLYLGFRNDGEYAGYREGLVPNVGAQVMVPAENLVGFTPDPGSSFGSSGADRDAFLDAIADIDTNPNWAPHTIGVALLDNHDWRPY